MKLGKLAPKIDHRTFQMDSLLHKEELPAPHLEMDWGVKLPADVGMMGNDKVGLCTVAGIAHLIQQWTINHLGTVITISDEDVLRTYQAITLFVNGVAFDPNAELDANGENVTDTGLALLDVLKFVRANGIGPDRHGQGLAFVQVNHHDQNQVRIAHELFGGLYTGVLLPQCSMDQVGSTWSSVDGPVAGGHCMATHKTHGTNGVGYLTWGARQPAAWYWFDKQTDEAFAILTREWVEGEVPAPSGFNMEKLRSFLRAL